MQHGPDHAQEGVSLQASIEVATPPSGTRVMVSGNDREMGGTMTVFTSTSVSTTWCCVDNVSRIFLCLCVHRAQLLPRNS